MKITLRCDFFEFYNILLLTNAKLFDRIYNIMRKGNYNDYCRTRHKSICETRANF